MLTLNQAEIGKTYQIVSLATDAAVTKHLQNLGLIPGTKVALVSMDSNNCILLLHNNRIGLTDELITQIEIKEPENNTESWLSLDQLAVGEQVGVVGIHGTGAVKRRLMDMGLTKGTEIFVRKRAPLGDPIEIYVRGYELTLRKDEAELVLVSRKG